MKRFSLIFVLILFLSGCVQPAPAPEPEMQVLPLVMPVNPYQAEFIVAAEKDEVYQKLIELAQASNLNPVTLEPNTGLLRFEQQQLQTADLDLYCKFPVIDAGSEMPLNTFQAWSQRLLDEGATSTMRGEVTLTVLLTKEHTERTRVSLRSNWAAVYGAQKQPCNSRGVFEVRMEKALREYRGYSRD